MSYILVADDEPDLRDILEMILKRAFALDVVLVESGNKAIATIKERGTPLVIISDHRMTDGDGFDLYQANKSNRWNAPFILCTTGVADLRTKFPDIAAFIEKPDIMGPVMTALDGILANPKPKISFVPIRISLLLRRGTAHYDLHMKLSDTKFIKVINCGEAFIPADAERFSSKGLHHLYITSADADLFLHAFEDNIKLILAAESKSSDLSVCSLESLESVERIAASLGWTPEVIKAAKHAVELAVKAVSVEPDIMKLFRQKLRDPTSKYSSHVSMLALLTCGFCHKLGWVSESTQMKMGLAALMHDLTVDEAVYQDVFLWNQAASDPHIKTPETVKYRNHPVDAANVLLSLRNIPPDVDQIILQHHETREGTGFPRGLVSTRITPMACVFIIVEDFINFMEDSRNFDEHIELFLRLRENRYSSGNFKKVFDAFKESVEKSRPGP